MIIDLQTNGAVESFTLSEITQQLGMDEEVIDVSINEDTVQLLTTERLFVFKP